MIQDVLRKFAQENFSHEYFPVLHGKTDKVQPLALVVRQHRPLWKRPFAKSKIIILARFDGYVEKGAQETVCEAITSNIRDEELSIKQKVDMAARDDEFDVGVGGFAGVTIKLCESQGVLTLGKLSHKYIIDPDLRGILANAELDANKMKSFAECDKLLLITSVIYSEKFELKGERMHQREMAAEVGNLPPSLQFLNLNRNSPLRIRPTETYIPPAAMRNSQAPFLFKCCRVDYNKETNRLEIRKGDYVGKVVTQASDVDTTGSEEDAVDDDILVETRDQTDLPDSLTAEDIVKLDIIKKEVLLAETTLERRKARVNKYLQWFERVLTTAQKELLLDELLTAEDCKFLKSIALPFSKNSNKLDLSSFTKEDIQGYGIVFKVLSELPDKQWSELETTLDE